MNWQSLFANILKHGHESIVGGWHDDGSVLDAAETLLRTELPRLFLSVDMEPRPPTIRATVRSVWMVRLSTLSHRWIRHAAQVRQRGWVVVVLTQKTWRHSSRITRQWWSQFERLDDRIALGLPIELSDGWRRTGRCFAWMQIARAVPKTVVCLSASAMPDLLDALHDEYVLTGRGFHCNRASLLCGFREGRLLGLRADPWSSRWGDRGSADLCALLATQCWEENTLPCFCQVDSDGRIEFLWTHPRCRGLGWASVFLAFVYEARGVGDEDVRMFCRSQPLLISAWLDSARGYWTRRGFDQL